MSIQVYRKRKKEWEEAGFRVNQDDKETNCKNDQKTKTTAITTQCGTTVIGTNLESELEFSS